MSTEVVAFIPYGLAFLMIFFMRVTPTVVRQFVIQAEVDEEVRERIEVSCLYAAAVSTLVAVSLSSWIVSMVKLAVALVDQPSGATAVILVVSLVVYAACAYFNWRYVQDTSAHDYKAQRRHGPVTLTVASEMRVLQAVNVTLGLAIDVVARHFK